MPTKIKRKGHLLTAHNPISYCDATGLPIVCVSCYRIPKSTAEKKPVCDFHRAVEDYRRADNIDDTNTFNLPVFIEKIDWNRVKTSCQPEIAMLCKGFKRINSDIARRVV